MRTQMNRKKSFCSHTPTGIVFLVSLMMLGFSSLVAGYYYGPGGGYGAGYSAVTCPPGAAGAGGGYGGYGGYYSGGGNVGYGAGVGAGYIGGGGSFLGQGRYATPFSQMCGAPSIFHYYTCCDYNLVECCINLETWVIVVLVLIGLLTLVCCIGCCAFYAWAMMRRRKGDDGGGGAPP